MSGAEVATGEEATFRDAVVTFLRATLNAFACGPAYPSRAESAAAVAMMRFANALA